MANGTSEPANADRCGKCGAVLALVGRVHRCIERPTPEPTVVEKSTYRHRDPEKRRAYQRDLMRRRRAQKNSSGGAAQRTPA